MHFISKTYTKFRCNYLNKKHKLLNLDNAEDGNLIQKMIMKKTHSITEIGHLESQIISKKIVIFS